jgi:hypothetical protein
MKEVEKIVPEKTVCPYFEAGMVEVILPPPLKSRQVPTPRCGLAEMMLTRLRTTAGGQEVAALLTITPENAAPRSMYGADLGYPVREICTLERLQTSCEPSFVQILTEHSLSPELPVRPLALLETS